MEKKDAFCRNEAAHKETSFQFSLVLAQRKRRNIDIMDSQAGTS